MKALSLWQPWAWLIMHGGKDVENRGWSTNHRGPLLIHAAKRKPSLLELEDIVMELDDAGLVAAGTKMLEAFGGVPGVPPMEFGGIVGRVNLDGCVRNSRSPWAADDLFHWLVSDPQPMRFEALCGRQGLFEVYFRHLPGSDRVEATTEP